jgi:DNA-binding transcriptional LysR family regulator
MMNIHHLELFYYVARHGGISEAVRNIPYGIQQPAVSSQVLQLEEFLGVTLFQRRPFQLTSAGEELFAFIEPFFRDIGTMALKIQGGTTHQLRLGASEIVLRDHIPVMLQNVRKQFPKLRVTLREGYQAQLEAWVERQEVDLAITVLNNKTAAGVHAIRLMDLPLVLIVPRGSDITSADQLWKRDRIDEPLISLPMNEAISKHFQAGLQKLGVDWFPAIEVSSVDLLEAYVVKGYGIGVSIEVPKGKLRQELRSLSLKNFEPVTIGVLWRGKATPLIDAVVREAQTRAQQINE